MYKDLDNYQPKEVKFILNEEVKEMFPTELNFKTIKGAECETVRDAIKLIGKEFTSTFPENELAIRELDNYEIANIREEYCIMQEQDLPKLVERLQELKQMLKDADDAVKGKVQEINTYASEVRAGIREARLKNMETFQIALAGYYLTYTWDRNKEVFVLAKAFEIPDRSEIWSNEEKNRAAMLEYFGLEFPEIDQKDEDLPFGEEE